MHYTSLYEENVYYGVDLEKEVFEAVVRCPWQNQFKISNDYMSVRQMKNHKAAYRIKRPISGHLKLKLFCDFCEKYYQLKIYSQYKTKRRGKINITFYSFVAYLFWYFPIEIVQYIVWFFLFYKILINLKDNFVKVSRSHEVYIVRKWEPIEAEYQE